MKYLADFICRPFTPVRGAGVICVTHRHGRKLQILDRTGPGMDHPVMSNCPENRYLKVVWAVVV